jgi:hypothetical protein
MSGDRTRFPPTRTFQSRALPNSLILGNAPSVMHVDRSRLSGAVGGITSNRLDGPGHQAGVSCPGWTENSVQALSEGHRNCTARAYLAALDSPIATQALVADSPAAATLCRREVARGKALGAGLPFEKSCEA